ncbi:ARMC3 protein, partial [Bucco capensis]|nr:ARMC3 protein [Bucco capensis]
MGKKVKKAAEPPPQDVFDPLLIESKTAATAVLMLLSPEEDILAKACDALYKFASKGDENKGTLVGLGALEHLKQLLCHGSPAVRSSATRALATMAAQEDVKKLLRDLDVTSSLIAQLAAEEDVVVHEFATLCLAHMAVEYTSKEKILEQGGLEPLVRLLSSPDPDVQKNSVECLYLLVQDFQGRAALGALNAIPPLLELLDSEFPIIQMLALQTLEVISKDSESRKTLGANQGLACLLKILDTEVHDLHVEALAVLGNCLQDVQSLQLIQQTEGLPKLLSIVGGSPLPALQRNAAKAIATAAYDSEIRKILHEEEVETCLLKLLGVADAGVRVAACQAISAMCENSASKRVLGLQGIAQLVQLLSSEDAEVEEAAVTALANVTAGSAANTSAVAEAEGLEPLLSILSSGRAGAAAAAAAVLTSLARHEPLRAHLQSHGILRALAAPLASSNSQLQSRAALAVAAFACDAEARAELRNAGGLGALVELLRSKDKEVRRNACWALVVCASDAPSAAELCSLGVLDILEELNLSLEHRNPFSEAAVEKLLGNNLAQKYSQLGYLSSRDIIPDGFYDCGQLRPGLRCLSLEELRQQELADRRAVIFISAQAPAQDKAEASSLIPAQEARDFNFRSNKDLGDHFFSPLDTKDLFRLCSRKGKGKKEEEKPQAVAQMTSEGPEELAGEHPPWSPPPDPILLDYIKDASRAILPLSTTREQVVALAQFVAARMGGPIDRDKLHDFSWELHLSQVELELKSNLVPIGRVKKGTFCHRALLFKVLADRLGLACALFRGQCSRGWNEVELLDESPPGVPGLLLPPRAYVVDVMFEPGSLLQQGSAEAELYK